MNDILGPMRLDRDYVRIKVEVDVVKPPLAGFWYTRRNIGVGRAEIKYERLLKFCFGCGRVGHIEMACKAGIIMSETDEGGSMYGPWLRVDRPKRRGQQCRVIGKSQSGKGDGNKKKSCPDIMKGKQLKEGLVQKQDEKKGGMSATEANVNLTREESNSQPTIQEDIQSTLSNGEIWTNSMEKKEVRHGSNNPRGKHKGKAEGRRNQKNKTEA